MICSNEGKTYPTICSLNEEAIERKSIKYFDYGMKEICVLYYSIFSNIFGWMATNTTKGIIGNELNSRRSRIYLITRDNNQVITKMLEVNDNQEIEKLLVLDLLKITWKIYCMISICLNMIYIINFYYYFQHLSLSVQLDCLFSWVTLCNIQRK